MVTVAPPARARKAIHDAGFLVAVAGLFIVLLGLDAPSPATPIVGVLLVAVGAAMVWLGSRIPRKPVPATLPPAG